MSHAPELIHLLTTLSNPGDIEIYHQSDEAIRSQYKVPGFFLSLQEVAADKGLPRAIRFLASLIVGREVSQQWRANKVIPADLKPRMRQLLFCFYEEDDLPMARCHLRVLVHVARVDYPRTWPTLLSDLSGPLQASFLDISNTNPGDKSPERKRQKTILLNSLWAWNGFVKEWRSVKLSLGTQVMTQLVDDLSGPMHTYLESLMARDPVLEDWELMESARYAFKVCARLAQWSFSRPKNSRLPGENQRMEQFMATSLRHLSHLQNLRLQLLSSPYFSPSPGARTEEAMQTLKSITKFIRAIGKEYVNLLHIDPKSFAAVEGAVGAVGWWWSELTAAVKSGPVPTDDDVTARYPKRFMLIGLTLFKNILPALSTEHHEVFNEAFIKDAFNLIVTDLLPLAAVDWEAWQDDPEGWLVAETDTGTGWNFEFRPSAERALMGLASAARESHLMQPLISQKLQEVMLSPARDLQTRIKQDSTLCAAGRLARGISGSIKLDQLLGVLMPVVQSNEPEDRILKRRIAWLIGNWVTSDEEAVKIPLVWQILVHLLSERGDSTDTCVNLSAAIAIKECVDVSDRLWEMDIGYFRPYLGQTVEQMLILLSEADTLPGKRLVLDALTVIIERTKQDILPYIATLTQAIPALWQSASGLDGQWLLKASLVSLTSKLVIAAGEAADNYIALVVPLVEESLQGAAKEHFEEDGLQLWQSALRNSASLTSATADSGYLKLVPFLVSILAQNLDLQEQALRLMESYLLLDSGLIFQAYGTQIVDAYTLALGLAQKQQVKEVLTSLDLVVRVVPTQQWAPQFASSGLFDKLCKGINDDKSSGTVLGAYLALLCRICVLDPNAFLELVQHAGSANGKGAVAQVEETLDAMWRAFDYLSESSVRKLVAMGFASMLTIGSPQSFERLDGEFVSVLLDVLGELKESQVQGENGIELVRHWSDTNALLWHELEGTQEMKRREHLENTDLVYSKSLTQFVSEALSQAQTVGMHPYWAKLDNDVKRQLEKLLN